MTDEEREQLRKEVEKSLHGSTSHAQAAQAPQTLPQGPHSQVRHVVGVLSGKGGVGKSLVTGILACELARRGLRVGILDADVTGPSIPRMLGLANTRATAADGQLIPATTATGIKVMSANLILGAETDPVFWRGPIAAGAIRQFWTDCAWGELDVLLVDMPPGTGDAALTVFQSLPVDGVVIVSSPQSLVQMIVGKALNMASTMHIPVLGLVENMSYVACPDCGKKIEVYGPSRLAQTAADYNVQALEQLPIDPRLAVACDAGTLEQDLPEGLADNLVATVEALVRKTAQSATSSNN